MCSFLKYFFAPALLLILFPGRALSAGSMCAEVKIQINQHATLERQAFDARMKINNGLSDISLKDIDVNIKFYDSEGNPVPASDNPDTSGARFFYRLDSMENINAVDGTGVVKPSESAVIHWLIIPSKGAAGDESGGIVYNVGAEFSYSLSGEKHKMTVTPDFIKVRPMPDLLLDYFLPKEVYGDDPFTETVEPAIPFYLGLRIRNQGSGPADKLKIESAQPKIIENKQGLLVDFIIQGSFVDDHEVSPSLLADIGDLKPGAAANVRWIMTAGLTGRFVSFDARITHCDELGGMLTSLISPENVSTHELAGNVILDTFGRDNIKDFLVKPEEGSDYVLYESEGSNIAVEDKTDESDFNNISSNTWSLDFVKSDGCIYSRQKDPYSGNKLISKVIRSDGKKLPLENAWLSSRMRKGKWEYFINIFDTDTTGKYTLYFSSDSSVNNPPVIHGLENKSVFENNLLEFYINADDEDNDELNFCIEPVPPGAEFTQIDNCRGRFSWTPSTGQSGSYRILATVSDGALVSKKYIEIRVKSSFDNDLDGMNDDWEMLHFGTLDRDGKGDFDNDGILDIDEFKYGTDPASSNAPSKPLISYPANGSEIKSLNPVLEIINSTDPDEDEILYEFEIYSDKDMSELLRESGPVIEQDKKTSWSPEISFQENKKYYWRVRASDGKGYSSWEYGSFFVNSINEPPLDFSIIYPENNSEVSTLTPKLIVNSSKDPDLDELRYRFEIFADSQLTDSVTSADNVSAGDNNKTSWMMGLSLEDNKRYWWKVSCYDEDGLYSETGINSFFVNTGNDAPSVPCIAYPEADSEIPVKHVDLTVKNSIDPDEDILRYRFVLDTSASFDSQNLRDSGFINESEDFTIWKVSGLEDNTWYYWKAMADDGTVFSNWAEGRFFVNTQNDFPSQPKVKNPGNNAWVNTLTPVLEVIESEDIDNDVISYEFELYKKEFSENIPAVFNVVSRINSVLVTTELDDNEFYFWRARAIDEHGLKSGWTELSCFFTDNNGVNDLPSISFTGLDNNIYTNKDSVIISWTDSDPDSNARISLYYDEDKTGQGKILIADNLHEDTEGTGDQYNWDIKDIKDGRYFIYAVIEDENSSYQSYSRACVVIDRTDPEASAEPAGGVYYEKQKVSAQLNEPGTIYYTNDGTSPDINSMVYNEPVEVGKTMTLKFAGIDLAGNMGSVLSYVYVINEIPSTPVHKLPKDGQWVNTLSPVLEVFPPEHVDTENIIYEFEVYEDRKLNHLLCSGQSSVPAWTADINPESSKSFYWRVRAVDDYQMASMWSLPAEFYINLYSDWQSQNIGHCWKKGGFENIGNRFVINASGFDIWGLIDTFRFTSQPVTGDCEIVSRVESLENTDKWAKAGIMIRESLKMNSRNVMVLVTPEKGITLQYRKRTGWITKSIRAGSSQKAPCWLKLKRTGNIFTAYKSHNGIDWEKIDSVKISMSSNGFAGMAVTSHNNFKTCRAVFTDTKISDSEN